jgi:hypothetical protein
MLSTRISAGVVVAVGLAALAMAAAAGAEDAPGAPDAASEDAAATTPDAASEAAAATAPDTASEGAAAAAPDKDVGRSERRRGRDRRRQAEAADAPNLECRSVRPTGSRMPQRVCQTPEQWAVIDAVSEQEAKGLLRRRTDRSASGL